SSGEIAMRTRGNRGYAVRQASAEAPTPNDRGGGAGLADAGLAANDAAMSRRMGPLLALVGRADGRFAAQANLRYPAATIRRKAEEGNRQADAVALFAGLADVRLGASWAQAAEAEQWLSSRRGKPPVAVWSCAAAHEKPFLDGKLDDALWRDAAVVPLAAGAGGELRLAHDGEYLYVAGLFPTAVDGAGTDAVDSAGGGVERSAIRRGDRRGDGRDADLTDRDHLELSIDIDRDYVTSFTLAVDAAGSTFDRCERDATWNPQWFAATRRESNQWSVEAAIPLAELTRSPPPPGTIWAVAARRFQPGVGIQSATAETSPQVGPGAFGWLQWESPGTRGDN
ncbi:MAG: hypothetical protein WD875_04620, partial [Pirellulales bacterium]